MIFIFVFYPFCVNVYQMYVCMCVCIPYLMGNNNLMGKLTLKDDQNLDKLRSKAMCESIEVEMRGQDMLFSRTLA